MGDEPTFGDLLGSAVNAFDYAGLDTPQMDARLLLLDIAGISHAELISQMHDPVSQEVQSQFAYYVSRRLSSEPVHRILGAREFYGRNFILRPEALIPRPDTETLIDAVLERVDDRSKRMRILDLGTGSGAIALTLACELSNSEIVAVDISPEAVKNCEENAARLGVASRVDVLCSDLFEKVMGTFDLIVSNPPYIPTGDLKDLSPEVQKHDPVKALDGGVDGLDFYRRIFIASQAYLVDRGVLVLEFGIHQAEPLKALAEKHGFKNVRLSTDLAGMPRVLTASC